MINLPHPVRVFLYTPATDLRKGFDALCGLVTNAFAQDPTSGHLFLFINRRRDRIKILYWDRDGLAIWYKRLETGSFQIPVVARDAMSVEMNASIADPLRHRSPLCAACKRYQRPSTGAEIPSVSSCTTG